MELEFKDYSFEEAAKAYYSKAYALPAEDKIGIFTATDFNGTGDFRWIKNRNELLDFILNIWIPTLTDDRDDEYYQYVEQWKLHLEKSEMTFKEIQSLLNDSPYNDAEMKWIGTIDELIKDKGFFADQVRDHFNENKPIHSGNKAEFIKFLEGYFWA